MTSIPPSGPQPEAPRSRELLSALSQALQILGSARDEREALSASFGHAVRAFSAEKALLLRVRSLSPLEFEALHSEGLDAEQVEALITGAPIDGVSPTQIKKAIDARQVQVVENSQLESHDASLTASLKGRPHSVLCAPVLDPWTRSVLAVLYFQTRPGPQGYAPADAPFLEAYAIALGQAFGLFLDGERRYRRLEADCRRLQAQDPRAPEILGDSEDMARLRAELVETFLPATAASPPRPILILGETGTGKDLVARYLHAYSPSRAPGPLVEANCAGLSGELAQATLFGHARGAFTGAVDAAAGLFRSAHRGTLFLDEVGDLPPRGQELLLKVLDQWTVQPLGESRSYPVDVLLLAATHRDLAKDVQAGRFRHDLYHRLKALSIRLTPLRERPGDIRPLLSHFLAQAEQNLKKRTRGLSAEALRALLAYSWPGNVRELAGVAAALVTHGRAGEEIDLASLKRRCPEVVGGESPGGANLAEELIAGSFKEARARFERDFFLQRLDLHRWDVVGAARSLGVSVATLYRYLQRHGLSRGDTASS